MMKKIYFMLPALALMMLLPAVASAQTDRKDVRRGNRDYRKQNWKEAEIDYRKALVKDSMSVAANYNLAADLYRQGDAQGAMKSMQKIFISRRDLLISIHTAEEVMTLETEIQNLFCLPQKHTSNTEQQPYFPPAHLHLTVICLIAYD